MKRTRISRKTFVLTAAIGSFIIMVTVIANTIRSSRQTIRATDEAVYAVSSFYLDAMADRRAKTITNLINNNFELLEKSLGFFEYEKIENQQELRDVIGKIKSLMSLSRYALVDEDNIVYTQYTTYTGGTRHEFLSTGKLAGRVIDTVYFYGATSHLCLVVPTDGLVLMGKNFKACFVQIDIKDIVDLLAFDDEGRTSFALYDKNGGNLSGTELGPVVSTNNLFDTVKRYVKGDKWDTFYNGFLNDEKGSLTFSADNADETLSFVPINGTDWEMVVLIRESVINNQIQAISENNIRTSHVQIAFTAILIFLFAGVLLLELRLISKKKLEAEQETTKTFRSMASTDALTGIRNKHAYAETEAAINHMIKIGELKELAVLVCDINGLKYVNDNFGHAAGDKLIKDASRLICDVFKNGSVFRVGGDEFTVLLQGRGFETKDETIAEFNRIVEENLQKNEVVVSIGHSVLGSGDRQIHDVFERADQMMYERKQQLKAMGAKTRE